MTDANKEFNDYIANIRRIKWVGVAERQLGPNVDNRISGEWVHNPYDYSVTMASAFQTSRLRTVYR
jgi:hypothetical protein